MKPYFIALALLVLPLQAAAAQPDITGLWVGDFFGNKVECHMEQRGQFLYGVAYVTARNGEKNTYHLVGVIQGAEVRAMHGSGNFFVGTVEEDDKASGTFHFKNGHSFAMRADRAQRGKTIPGGLSWPDGYPPKN